MRVYAWCVHVRVHVIMYVGMCFSITNRCDDESCMNFKNGYISVYALYYISCLVIIMVFAREFPDILQEEFLFF